MGKGGILEEAKGRLKEAAGALLDDEDLKNEGRLDRAAGKAKEKADEVVDTARNAVKPDDAA